MKVRNFPLSLTGPAFEWFTSLPSCSIGSWAELEENFHNHFYNGAHETRLSHLASVRQGRDESVLDFFKRFREIKNRHFHLMISERDLIDLCFAGLRTSIRPTQPNSVRLTLTRTCTPPLMLRLQLLVSRWTATQPAPVRLAPASHAHPAPRCALLLPLTLSLCLGGTRSRPPARCAPIRRCLALSHRIPRRPGRAPITHRAPVKHLQHETLGCNIRLTQMKHLKHTIATYI